MNARKRTIARARAIISDERLIAFFRSIRRASDVFAVKLVNEDLDNGETLDQTFHTGDDFGYELSVQQLPGSVFRISFGCQAGPDAGDGGKWDVIFDKHDNVSSVTEGQCWIS